MRISVVTALLALIALSECKISGLEGIEGLDGLEGLGGLGGPGGFGRRSNKPGTPKAPAHKSDIPFIQCPVCDKIVQVMRSRVKDLRAGTKKLDEASIMDSLEQMCDPDLDAGDWITKLDLVEDGSKLNVVDKGQVGNCDWECRTVARACTDIMEDADLSDFSQLLYNDADGRAQLLNWLCYESTNVCRKKVPAVPQDRPVGPQHRPLTESDISAQKVMRSMKASGLSGTMMDREQMKQELDDAREMGFLDDEEDADKDKAASPDAKTVTEKAASTDAKTGKDEAASTDAKLPAEDKAGFMARAKKAFSSWGADLRVNEDKKQDL